MLHLEVGHGAHDSKHDCSRLFQVRIRQLVDGSCSSTRSSRALSTGGALDQSGEVLCNLVSVNKYIHFALSMGTHDEC